MKNFIKTIILPLFLLVCFSCDDWTIPENKKFVDMENNSQNFEKTEEYWENLRAYRHTDHHIAWGWFGYWNGGEGSTTRGALASAPDSMDIFSVFGHYMFNLTPKQIEDMRYVQNVKGQKVVFTFLMQHVGLGFEQSPEGVIQYAHALCDTVKKYGYDGIDLDYEPNYGGGGYFSDKEQVALFVKELAKELGPKSGTDKLLIIDGEPDYILDEIRPYFNYAVGQAYRCPGYSDLNRRWSKIAPRGWKKEQFIVTEEFQLLASTGGVSFRLPSGETVPSLIGMANWARDNNAGGCGAYHMEHDYNNFPNYRYLRQAIQIMNPAVK